METDESTPASAKSVVISAARETGKPRLSIWRLTREASGIWRQSDVERWLKEDPAFRRAFDNALREGRLAQSKSRSKGGRPRSLDAKARAEIPKLIRHGWTLSSLAKKWGVCDQTLLNERRNFPEFDAAVREALRNRKRFLRSDANLKKREIGVDGIPASG